MVQNLGHGLVGREVCRCRVHSLILLKAELIPVLRVLILLSGLSGEFAWFGRRRSRANRPCRPSQVNLLYYPVGGGIEVGLTYFE